MATTLLRWARRIIRRPRPAALLPLAMVDGKGRLCRMELVGNDWLYRAHPTDRGARWT